MFALISSFADCIQPTLPCLLQHLYPKEAYMNDSAMCWLQTNLPNSFRIALLLCTLTMILKLIPVPMYPESCCGLLIYANMRHFENLSHACGYIGMHGGASA